MKPIAAVRTVGCTCGHGASKLDVRLADARAFASVSRAIGSAHWQKFRCACALSFLVDGEQPRWDRAPVGKGMP